MKLLPLLVIFFVSFALADAPAVTPLPRAHAHNDYEHARPLLDALDNGFCSVEADIYLVEGKLLVGHSLLSLRPDRTLQSLYLDPLLARVRANHGNVYPGGPAVTLFIDIKSEALSTYNALAEVLERYKEMLTVYHDGTPTPGAVNILITGNRNRPAVANAKLRYAALDGLLNDLDASKESLPPDLVPVISHRWGATFKWNGTGDMPRDERERLKTIVSKAHAAHRRIRFWGAPDNPPAWTALLDAGVDLINTDKLPVLRAFLLAHSPSNQDSKK